jgi:hypothetical protein
MNFKKISKYLAPITLVTLVSWAWQSAGWEGIVMAVTGFVMWLLLYFTNIMMVMRRARNSPIGYVSSAVMFQSKLKEGMTHLNVIGYSRSLGERLSPKDEEPEVFLWKDNNDNRVTATFVGGKLQSWEFKRPKLVMPDQDPD